MEEEIKKIVWPIKDQSGNHHGWMIQCPACDTTHVFDDRWIFNNNFDKPTFTPSMLVAKNSTSKAIPRCHSFVTDGKIKFLGDCTHAMKNKTVDLEKF